MVEPLLCLQLFSDSDDAIDRFGPPLTNDMKESSGHGDSLVLIRNLKWDQPANNGTIHLTVKFIGLPQTKNPHKTLQSIINAAKLWEDYANIKFDFKKPDEDATIRCGFVAGEGHFSYVGKHNIDETRVKPGQQTMNLEFYDHNDEAEIRGTTLHEFGHAIGCSHEQVNPDIAKQGWVWNQEAVIKYYTTKSEGKDWVWTLDDVNRNFNSFKPLDASTVHSTKWDRSSVMQYSILQNWTTPELKEAIPRNLSLTQYDKDFIRQMYPGAPVKSS